MNPLVSLVITAYNRQDYLQAAIESVLQQTYPHFELIIWDDGSTDDSPAIARHYARRDARLRAIAAPHLGFSQALRRALDQTRGPYLAWVDSDDLLAPSALAETTAILESSPHVGMVYTDYYVIDADGKLLGLGQRCQIPYSKQRLLLDFMTFHFRLLRREVYEAVGGVNPEFEAAQDYDLCLRLSEASEITHLAKSLYYYRHHRQSISHLRQFEQMQFSARAIQDALVRRGLADRYELEVQPRYLLRRKLRPKFLKASDKEQGSTREWTES